MSKTGDTAKQVRLTGDNWKNLRDLKQGSMFPFSLCELANMAIKIGLPRLKIPKK